MVSLAAFTTPGLVKTVNEDALGIRFSPNEITVCICDGHWGQLAAQFACQTFLNRPFPSDKNRAIKILDSIQTRLFRLQDSPKPPETSVLAVKINLGFNTLHFVSYGDCRLMISRDHHPIFNLPTCPTWLGALSFKNLRHRIPVSQATQFGSVTLKKTDRVLLFTDGVDECVYEPPTISNSWLASHTPDQILNRICRHGAQDNATFVNLQVLK